jgi:hypothetical protein
MLASSSRDISPYSVLALNTGYNPRLACGDYGRFLLRLRPRLVAACQKLVAACQKLVAACQKLVAACQKLIAFARISLRQANYLGFQD